MPLDRHHVTNASRVMLPVYTFFAAYIGVCYSLDPGHRLAGIPPFPLFPSAVWGAGFLAFTAGFLLAFITSRRELFVGTLSLMMVWLALWAVGLAKGAFLDGHGTYTSWLFPGFVAAACWATMLSLLAREA